MIMDDGYMLCIGERCNSKEHRGERLEKSERVWLAHPVRCVLSSPAFSWGQSRARLVKMIGTSEFRGRNLLWPHHRSGEWDARVAGEVAMRVLPYLPPKTVLLGRRVATAFNCGHVSFGETEVLEGREFLVLPHPSGRSRVCNCEVELELMREAYESFLRA